MRSAQEVCTENAANAEGNAEGRIYGCPSVVCLCVCVCVRVHVCCVCLCTCAFVCGVCVCVKLLRGICQFSLWFFFHGFPWLWSRMARPFFWVYPSSSLWVSLIAVTGFGSFYSCFLIEVSLSESRWIWRRLVGTVLQIDWLCCLLRVAVSWHPVPIEIGWSIKFSAYLWPWLEFALFSMCYLWLGELWVIKLWQFVVQQHASDHSWKETWILQRSPSFFREQLPSW